MQIKGVRRDVMTLHETQWQKEHKESLPDEICTFCGMPGKIAYRCTSLVHGEQRKCYDCKTRKQLAKLRKVYRFASKKLLR